MQLTVTDSVWQGAGFPPLLQVVHLLGHATSSLVQFLFGSPEGFKTDTFGLSSRVLGVNGMVQGKASRAVLLFIRHQGRRTIPSVSTGVKLNF